MEGVELPFDGSGQRVVTRDPGARDHLVIDECGERRRLSDASRQLQTLYHTTAITRIGKQIVIDDWRDQRIAAPQRDTADRSRCGHGDGKRKPTPEGLSAPLKFDAVT